MAVISLKGMRFYAFHGCFDEERHIGTYFVVNTSFETDASKAQKSDNIADTVNYLEVYQAVKREMEVPSHLLEHVADRIGEALLLTFPAIDHLTVEVNKMNPPLGGHLEAVSVTITKDRSPRN